MPTDKFSGLFAKLNARDEAQSKPADPTVLTDNERAQLPPDLSVLTQRQIDDCVHLIAEIRIRAILANSRGLVRNSPKLAASVAGQCRDAIFQLAKVAQEKAASEALAAEQKITEEVRLSRPYEEARIRLQSIPNTPAAIQTFVQQLITEKLIADGGRWWVVSPGNEEVNAGRTLAHEINAKRTEVFMARINNCRDLDSLYDTAKDLIRKGLVNFYNSDSDFDDYYFLDLPSDADRKMRELLDNHKSLTSRYSSGNTWGTMPTALADAFNRKRDKFILNELKLSKSREQ